MATMAVAYAKRLEESGTDVESTRLPEIVQLLEGLDSTEDDVNEGS